jgi:hypothetical protein
MQTEPNNTSNFSLDSNPLKNALPPVSILTQPNLNAQRTVNRQFLFLRILAIALHYVLPGRDVTADVCGVNQS